MPSLCLSVLCATVLCRVAFDNNGHEAFLIQYVDDFLISGQPQAVAQLKTELKKYFQCKFNAPKDFLGLDITNPRRGEITLSMHSFTTKMQNILNFKPKHEGPVLTPGRTDKKVIRGLEIEKDDQYRSKYLQTKRCDIKSINQIVTFK